MNLYQLYVKFHEEEKNNPELVDEAREWFARLERGEDEARELWQWFSRTNAYRTQGNLFDLWNPVRSPYW